jgi:hypothetical protein
MSDTNLQDNGSQGDHFEGGAQEAAAWAADAGNFTVPQGELPRTLERRIVNDKPVKDRFDARKWQQHYTANNERFNECYEFRYEYRPVEDDQSNDFYATYHLKGADGAGEGATVTDGAADAGLAEGGETAGARSTAAYTGAGARNRDASGGEAASQGLWRSYYAQQRERDVVVNTASYRRDHYRDVPVMPEHQVVVEHLPVEHHNTFDYRAGHARQLSTHYERRASPVRSHSPVRVVSGHEEAALAHAAQAASFQYTHSFSLYEQHREQRE